MLAQVQVFSDVPVVPVTLVHQHVALGGPIWPDFANQTWVRHCRAGEPMDQMPAPPEGAQRMAGDAVWGGFLDGHFGHFVADHLPRLPAVLRERPDDTYLFTVDPGVTRDTLPEWVAPVLQWIGLPMAQVRLVVEPLVMDRLWVGRQGEMLPQVGPLPGYLEMIEPWARGLVPKAAGLLYVTRMGLSAKGAGVHAGEAYVVGLLDKHGVSVLDPATAPLADQLAAYAGAGRILFAEGPALHGRQLLGRLDQDIGVLKRRPGKRMAEASLKPRCRKVSYHDVGDQILMAYWKSGAKRPNPALSLYDVGRLLRSLASYGIDLKADWDHAAYAEAALADVEAWVAWHQSKDKHVVEYAAVLQKAGLI